MFNLSPHLPEILAAYSILVVGASSPGPSVALLIGIATEQGRTPALMATLGIAIGSMTINIITIFGVELILLHAAWMMTYLRVIGALYLSYLAYGAFKKSLHPPTVEGISVQKRSYGKLFVKGYLLQITNPKTISFWLAIASIGAVEGASFGVVVLFVLGALVISFSGHAVWVVVLSVSRIRQAYAQFRRRIEFVLGSFLAFAAYRLATSND